jgi:DinB superfamily
METNIYAPQLGPTFKKLQNILSSFSEEQLNTVPFEGSWTPGQVGDHLLRSYGITEVMNGRTKPADRPADAHVELLKKVFLDFEIKLKSPDFIIPTNEHINKNELLENIAKRAASIINAAQTKEPTEICLDFEMPNVGTLTRLELTCFVLVHTQRHIHQLENIAVRIR